MKTDENQPTQEEPGKAPSEAEEALIDERTDDLVHLGDLPEAVQQFI